MSELLYGTLLAVMAVVITREQILDAVPAGTSEREAIAYFEKLVDEDSIHYREVSTGNTVDHELEEGEAGYYLIGFSDVRRHWWWPSFGRQLAVLVVISDDRVVTEVKFFGSRTGWP